MAERKEVYEAIDRERLYQRARWGDRPMTVQAWLLVVEEGLNEAKRGWAKTGDDAEALREVLQVAACCVACMEQNGVVER